MKRHTIICLLSALLSPCIADRNSTVPLDSVEVYYRPTAPWGYLRFETYGIDNLISGDREKFRIQCGDSLECIYRMCADFRPDSSRQEKYEDAVIVAILNYGGRTDTLVTNAYPTFRMTYNSCPVHDENMAMYLIEAVVQRNALWKEAYDSLYYNGDFNFLSRSGMSQEQWFSGYLMEGCMHNHVYMSSPDYMVCLDFKEYGHYDTYLFDESAYFEADSLDSSFLKRDDVFLLNDRKDLPPEIVYDIVHVDSNLVYCRFLPQYKRNEFAINYHCFGNFYGYRPGWLTGYYRYWLSTVYPEQERKRIFGAREYPPKNSVWRELYEGTLSSYFQERIVAEQTTDCVRLNFREKMRMIFYELELKISHARHRNRHPDTRPPVQTLPLDEAMRMCNKMTLMNPVLYLPFPLGSSAYIFDKERARNFAEDSFYCGKKNFYATYYELPAAPEAMCRIISYDSNGVLAEILPEANELQYLLTLIPENAKMARGHVLNSENYSELLRGRKLASSPEWAKVRTADKVSHVMKEYDPQIFINAFPLVRAYVKSPEFRNWEAAHYVK